MVSIPTIFLYNARVNRSLLQTKLTIPPNRPSLVPRPRLIQALSTGLDGKLTLISAPAGFGKTTLIANWLQNSSLNIQKSSFAWLSLDTYDDDPNQFWQYALAALQTAVPHLGSSTHPLLSANPFPPPPVLLTGLLNELTKQSQTIILILDDYHVISDKQIHEGLDYLLDHAPPQLHLVLLTRADPPLSLSRLRARGLLHELRLADLRFTLEETAVFLQEKMKLPLSIEDISALEMRTEGWIAGLQLTAVSLQRQRNTRQFIKNFSGSHHFILEYLTEEVLQQQPKSIQTFLLETAILSRLCGSLCDAVTRRNDSQKILTELVRQNLFIMPLDDNRHWFRTHQLLAELLRTHLKQTYAAKDVQILHDRASHWYEDQEDWETAVFHAIKTEDWDRVADLVAKAYQPLIAQGRVATWQRWLTQIPTHIVQNRTELLVRQGWGAFLNGQLPQAEAMLKKAHTQLLANETSPALRGELATYLATIAFFHEDPDQIIESAEEALAYLPPEALASRSRATGALGLGVSLAGDTSRAMHLYREAAELARAAKNPFLLAHALEVVADAQFHTGKLRAAANTCQEIINLGSQDRPVPLPFTGNGYVKLASIYLEWHQLVQAEEAMATSLTLNQQGAIGYNLLPDTCLQIRLRHALGDQDGALTALRQAENMIRQHPSNIAVVQLTACAVPFWLSNGDTTTAAVWATGAYLLGKPLSLADLPIISREVMQVTQARIHLAQNHVDKVLAVYHQINESAQSAGRLARVIEIGLLAALAYEMKGKTAVALNTLRQVLKLTQPEGYVQIFIESGEPIRHLLQQPPANEQTEYVQTLLKSFPDTSQSLTTSLVAPLSPRELEVLQFIAMGMSNKQIADKMTVSLNTIKKHTSHIYEKLGVNGRLQAVERAREYHLL